MAGENSNTELVLVPYILKEALLLNFHGEKKKGKGKQNKRKTHKNKQTKKAR